MHLRNICLLTGNWNVIKYSHDQFLQSHKKALLVLRIDKKGNGSKPRYYQVRYNVLPIFYTFANYHIRTMDCSFIMILEKYLTCVLIVTYFVLSMEQTRFIYCKVFMFILFLLLHQKQHLFMPAKHKKRFNGSIYCQLCRKAKLPFIKSQLSLVAHN